MEKPDSEVTGYAIEWKVEPSLWRGGETKTLRRVGIEFILYGERIRAEIKGVNINQEDFDKKATGIAQTVTLAYGLTKDTHFSLKRHKLENLKDEVWSPLIVCKSRVRIQSSFAIIVRDAKGNIVRDTEEAAQEFAWEIIGHSAKDVTLKGALNYYWLASEGTNQLATAGNLYMAMEELLARFNEGKKKKDWRWEEVTNQLVQFNSKLARDNLSALKQLHRGRHAFDDNGNKNRPLTHEELVRYKRLVREYLLAYVEWLKKRS